jgi:hypothetical protein
MRALNFLLLIVLASTSLGAIVEYIPAPHPEMLRESADFAYNSGRDQIHFYGTGRWAVYFDPTTYFGGENTSITFTPQSAVVFLPNTVANDSIRLEIRAETTAHQPSSAASGLMGAASLHSGTEGLQGAHTITLPTIAPQGGFWVVAYYQTSVNGGHMAASEGDGSHSFYWEPQYAGGYYLNLAEWVHPAELLIGLNGVFTLPGTAIEVGLTSFLFNQPFAGGATLTPLLTVKNYSGQSVPNLSVRFIQMFPTTLGIDPDTTVTANVTLAPHETRVVSPNVIVNVPDNSGDNAVRSQFDYIAEIDVPGDSTDLSGNNRIERMYTSINLAVDNRLLENFARSTDQALPAIWNAQSAAITPETVVLNCFSDVSDASYFRPDAYDRFLYYGLWCYPSTVTAGEWVQSGYHATQYADTLAAYLQLSQQRTTFLRSDSLGAVADSEGVVTAYIKLKNRRCNVFTTYLAECSFHAAFVEKQVAVGNQTAPGYVMQSMLTGAGEAVGNLTRDGSQVFEVSYNPGSVVPFSGDFDVSRFAILCWIQHETTHQIDFCDLIPLTEFGDVAVQDPPPATHRSLVGFGPNPLRQGSFLRFQAAADLLDAPARVSIYNLRGQMVRRLSGTLRDLSWDGSDEHRRLLAQGVYLMRIETRRGEQVARCVLLR